ncbi:rhodanese-like domain-containing protein [Paenibacillus zeisoli]|nr:rhodanese-like domain-containing protein [Paenibacillus zeisoli]
MTILILLVILGILGYIRTLWPVKGLSYVDAHVLREKDRSGQKLLDVRDAYDYEKCHIQGSINISIGRLPFVWKKDISAEDSVLILADSMRKSRKAARILRKHGFQRLQVLRGDYCESVRFLLR